MEKKNYDEMSLEELRAEYHKAVEDNEPMEREEYIRTSWDDDESEEVIAVDKKKMIILLSIMAAFLVIPLVLNIARVIDKLWMTILFVPAVGIMSYLGIMAKKSK